MEKDVDLKKNNTLVLKQKGSSTLFEVCFEQFWLECSCSAVYQDFNTKQLHFNIVRALTAIFLGKEALWKSLVFPVSMTQFELLLITPVLKMSSNIWLSHKMTRLGNLRFCYTSHLDLCSMNWVDLIRFSLDFFNEIFQYYYKVWHNVSP